MCSRTDFNCVCNVISLIMLRFICLFVTFPFSNQLNEVCDDLLYAIMSITVLFLYITRKSDIYFLIKTHQTTIKNKTSYKDIDGAARINMFYVIIIYDMSQ